MRSWPPRGELVSLESVLAQQQDRDQRDAARPVGALVKAADAVEVWTDGLSPDEVIDRLEQIVREKMPKHECRMSKE